VPNEESFIVFIHEKGNVFSGELELALFDVTWWPDPDFKNNGEDVVSEMIQEFVGGSTWDDIYGVQITAMPGHLLVRQTPENLDAIVKLFKKLKNPVKVGEE